jgi:UDP-glucose 4-epimerase
MFNVYGPRQSLTNPYQGAMAIFIGNVLRGDPITIFGNGEQSRDFVYIDDVVRAWTYAIENEESYGKIFNIGFGKRTSINELVETIIRTFGKDPATYSIRHKKERPGDQRHMEADMRFSKKILSFTPSVHLSNGIRRTIEWAQGKKSSDR